MVDTKKPTKRGTARDESPEEWTPEELEAVKEHRREMKANRRGAAEADGEAQLLAKIAEMPPAERVIAEKIHAIVKATAPDLGSRTFYGMPAWTKDGKVLAFFQPGAKFKSRYSTLGFNDPAKLDDGDMWPTTYALTKLTTADEKRIEALIRKAVG